MRAKVMAMAVSAFVVLLLPSVPSSALLVGPSARPPPSAAMAPGGAAGARLPTIGRRIRGDGSSPLPSSSLSPPPLAPSLGRAAAPRGVGPLSASRLLDSSSAAAATDSSAAAATTDSTAAAMDSSAAAATDSSAAATDSSAAADTDSSAAAAATDGLRFRETSRDLSRAALVGIASGLSVAIFKLSVEALMALTRTAAAAAVVSSSVGVSRWVPPLLPALGGAAVGILSSLGGGRRGGGGGDLDFPPGLLGTVRDVDADSSAEGPGKGPSAKRLGLTLGAMRKSAAAAFTLGTGNSLGPEGPSVEIGMSVARAWVDGGSGPSCGRRTAADWNRLLLACGAAAGVAAGFNAPFAGVFFALEVVRGAFADVDAEGGGGGRGTANGDSAETAVSGGQGVLSTTADATPIILASALSALVARAFLGDHLFLHPMEYSLRTPLVELPLYLILGAVSGFVAFAFGHVAKMSRAFFTGDLGGRWLRAAMASVPPTARPILGGLACGAIGLAFPQVLFFGHGTLNALLANASVPTASLLSLLAAKILATAAAAGSGLVGGTFAPSLFLGAVAGGAFHNVASGALLSPIADLPAYTMVGAASVLAALFRAPLTASLLLFELTRDYAVVLPLMASAGVGSVVGDILDDKFERSKEKRRDRDAVSWGDLADRLHRSNSET